MSATNTPQAVRALIRATAVNAFGNGLFLVGGLLFFTKVLDLPVGQVGLGLTIAGFAGLLTSVPAGVAADRFGARRVFQVTLVIQAVATALFLFSHSFPVFLISAIVAAAGQKAARATNSALIGRLAGERRVSIGGMLRSVNNLGMSAGALCGGLGIGLGTDSGYQILLILDVLTFLGTALLVMQIPDQRGGQDGIVQVQQSPLRDVPYLSITALNAVLSIQYSMLTVALPLWVSAHTQAPSWMVSILLAMNTAMVVLFQVRAGRGVTGPEAAAAYTRVAGLVFLVSAGMIGVAGRVPLRVAVLLLVIGVFIHTIAELWHAAAMFELGYGLAPPHSQGRYQGVFSLGMGVAEAVSPALLAATCIALGLTGWLLIGGLLAVAGIILPAVVHKRTVHKRPEGAAHGTA
jgi:MFS family permease